MKKICLLCFLFAFGQTSFAQTPRVPEPVRTAFAKAYPNARDVDWELEKGHFEAEFELSDGQEMSVLYDATGSLLMTEVEIDPTGLPPAAQKSLQGKKIREVAKITDAKGTVTYEVEWKRGEQMFDSEGKPLK